MRKLNWLYGLAALAILMLLAVAAYRLPPIHNRLAWRVDFAMAKLRGRIDPIQAMPTALPEPQVEVASLPTATHLPTLIATHTPTPTPEYTPTPQPSPTPLPDVVTLPAPEWEKQDINNCGPAALTMYLRYYGWEGDQTTITEVIKPFREDRNVNVEELAYFVRNYAGWLNIQYRVGGDLETLKKLLAAGVPVMVEETFLFDEPFWTNDDLWAAHYQVLTGYDDPKKIFIGQDSYHGPNLEIPYKKLDEYWQAFNRVYILVYPPEQEAAIKDILGNNWDPDVNRQNALDAAQADTQADPDNAFAWFNLGNNLTYFERYIEATDAFDTARQIGLPQRMLRYQFTPFLAYFHTGQIDDLVTLSEYALKVTPNSEEALLWHGWAMYRQGDTPQAVENFQQALVENPNYIDAQYALDFVRGN
jgi:tetratricopeptide (TPR) repeat protein